MDTKTSSVFNTKPSAKMSFVESKKLVVVGSYPQIGSELLADLLAQELDDGTDRLVYFREPFGSQYVLTSREEKVFS